MKEGHMPEDTNDQSDQQGQSNDQADNSGFTPPATQAELNRIIAERVSRERAKFGDYNDLKTKAAQFDALDEASKTEQQKLAERADAAEKRALELEARSLRLEVASEKGLTPAQAKRLVGTSREELEADADELLSTFKPAEPVVPDLDLGPRATGSPEPSTAQERINAGIAQHMK